MLNDGYWISDLLFIIQIISWLKYDIEQFLFTVSLARIYLFEQLKICF